MGFTGIKGKVALVTGAAQGIGEAVARALAELGAIVAAVDLNVEGLKGLVADLSNHDHQAKEYPVNVGDSSAVESIVERIERELGPIEILVNVAGILRVDPIESLSDEDWVETFNVNTNGVFYVSRSVVKRMALRQTGSIVTVGSNATRVPRMHMSAYAASKAAATMFTKCLGLEQSHNHIRCNVVSPGSTDTAMQRALWNSDDEAQGVIAGNIESHRVGIPLGRLAMSSDIADAVLYLLSDQARHITMQDLCIDGGATLGS
ncbi:2,3-dihydro-2,3-dihydroxybenzoate dehydrogenase [Paenibacillus macquariensis]|uniref:2,3-dihydro-2,3-dihydroxybenzoate dehydrogenase n=1 Tax=Paenibacillus macquariensis TaxID=948756 RepID=A0ABY1JML4_9BACL|nr:2,3-dihydro-2,3-dihydroxybenzoate dehydrogenase [Paenibacillus macquariensis]MEC0092276.1 2,3-dihydro-2,3-dihydroxybenzoate dehydrogenase [Paenibacillus macquariensis]OAB37180.1 2,3-dihydro-2,3-dihydroxybenzoate dehydrogenase [Paenibacillus macquariensis subsp. macquariensis]SIQ47211.1 2,3-dihydro-2,3-dihydroxybenzoate dehydrogenase [Paenibacillus macquariensis]